MCEHDWIIDFYVVEGECNEAGDLMVFGGRKSEGEPGAVCERCAQIWGKENEYDHDLLYVIKFLNTANFPKSIQI